MRRRSPGSGAAPGLALLLAAAVVAGGCETPTYPRAGFGYEFRLVLPAEEGSDSLVFHWDPGRTVRVFIPEPEVGERPSLREAFVRAAGLWNRAAVFAEVRLEETPDLAGADVVLRWLDTPSPVIPPSRCGGPVIGGAAATVGCVARVVPDEPVPACVDPRGPPVRLQRWTRADDRECSRVRLEVTLSTRSVDAPERVRRLVAHEMGHVVGIMNHSQESGDLMFGGLIETDSLTRRDRSTLSIVYQSPRSLFP